MKETWKDIKGYEGLYQVSNLGRVRSLDRIKQQNNSFNKTQTNHYKGKVLSLFSDKDDYLRVNLKKDGVLKQYGVHWLVANNFLKKSDFKFMVYEDKNNIDLNVLQINHKDENKQNNSVYNLEFCTPAYNVNYGKRKQQILQTDLEGNVIHIWESRKNASENLHISRNTINKILRGEKNSIKGYIFKVYREENEAWN